MDRREASAAGAARAQVLSKPALIREVYTQFDRQVRQRLDHETVLGIRRIFAGGSGDSHNAALATELAFEAVAQVPMEALTGMALARYTVPWLTRRDYEYGLAIGISISGEVSRTVEALCLARERGLRTMALTAHPESALAQTADLVLDVAVPPPAESPGVRSYLGALMAMYALAFRFAEVREAISQAEGDRWRKEMLRVADVIEATNRRISNPVRELARKLRDQQYFMFVGSGPNYGTALFGAAKLVEATGHHVLGQDIEEWAHLQRFDRGLGTPCFLIAPAGASYRRAVELAGNMKRTGKFLIAVVEEGEGDISAIADVVLPVCGHVPEVLTPLVYSGALELFASDLAQEIGEPYFRFGREPWESSGGNKIIRAVEIAGSLREVQDAAGNHPG